MLDASELRGFSRRAPENQSGKRFQNQILSGIGQHRDEYENCENSCLRVLPHLRQRCRKGAFLAGGLVGR